MLPTPRLLCLALAVLGSAASTTVVAQQTLQSITVTGPHLSPLQANAAAERARLERIPGGTNLILPQQNGRLATLRDALDYQPGIVVQDFFGGLDQPRLNIRGSGIQSNPVNRGILLLQDGLPLNEADGSFVISLLELRNAAVISARRGSNAISPGATTLGGELDFQTFSGTSNDTLRLEGGSFGKRGVYAAKGFESKQLDGRISVSHDYSSGFRHHSRSQRSSIHANVGSNFGNGFANRTYLSYTDLDFEIPGPVPRAAMMNKPRSILGDGKSRFDKIQNIYQRDPNRRSRQFRISNRSQWGSESLQQTLGVYWQSIDDTFTHPFLSHPTKGHTSGAQWRLAGETGPLGYQLAISWQHSQMDRELHATRNGNKVLRFADYKLDAENRNLLLGLNWQINPHWQLISDVKYSKAIRNADERLKKQRLNQQWHYLSPKAGIQWTPSEGQRWYSSLSRSHEAPTYWEIIQSNVPPQFGLVPTPPPPILASIASRPHRLDVQRANTLEIGGSGSVKLANHDATWSFSLYRSKVRDELMAVSDLNGTPKGTFNYRGHTRHQGLEGGISGAVAGTLDYRIAYTYSDFSFTNGEYAGNQIAGIPKHLLSAELMIHLKDWRIGPNLRWLSSTYTDHVNASGFRRDGFALWGLKIDYRGSGNWSGFVQIDNLGDKIYASSHIIRDRSPAPDAPAFLAGNGRSLFAGLNYRF